MEREGVHPQEIAAHNGLTSQLCITKTSEPTGLEPLDQLLQSLCNARATMLQDGCRGATNSLNRNLPALVTSLESVLQGLIRGNLIIKKRCTDVGR